MNSENQKDELIGNWYTEEKGLGFSAVWCCQITFNPDNTGVFEDRSSTPFVWHRLNATTIKIIMKKPEPDEIDRLIEEKLKTGEWEGEWETVIEDDLESDDWETVIEYVITDYRGVLFDIPYKKLTGKDSQYFWIVPEHLIKSLYL